MLRLKTAHEIAALLRVHRNTVLRYARTGVLPAVRVGHRVLFDPVEIEKAIKAHRPSGTLIP